MPKEVETIVFPDQYKVIGADLSLKRPGFCILSVKKEDGQTKIKVRKLFSVDNKTDKKKTHGQLLSDIHAAVIKLFFPIEPNTFFILSLGFPSYLFPLLILNVHSL